MRKIGVMTTRFWLYIPFAAKGYTTVGFAACSLERLRANCVALCQEWRCHHNCIDDTCRGVDERLIEHVNHELVACVLLPEETVRHLDVQAAK